MANTWTKLTDAQRKLNVSAKAFGSIITTVSEARDALDKGLIAAVIHAADHGDTGRYLQIMQALGQNSRKKVQEYIQTFAPIFVKLNRFGDILENSETGQALHGKLKETPSRSKEEIDAMWDVKGLIKTPYSQWRKDTTETPLVEFDSEAEEKLLKSFVSRYDKILDGESKKHTRPEGVQRRRVLTKRNAIAELCGIDARVYEATTREEENAHPMAQAA